MCTSIVVNKKKTIVGWNLDLLDMEYRVSENDTGVFIEIYDNIEGWMPLFGASAKGNFVGMPTCWPYDKRSDPQSEDDINVIMLDIDLLLGKSTFQETYEKVKNNRICSVKGLTFMSCLSDSSGNVLHIIPGQGYKYYQRPKYKTLTNFSPYKGSSEVHPWMGLDRYQKAEKMLKDSNDDFDVDDCFKILKEVSQVVCPTVVSMVFDVNERTVYWCEKRDFNNIKIKKLIKE